MPTPTEWLNPLVVVEQLVTNFQLPVEASKSTSTGLLSETVAQDAQPNSTTEDPTIETQVDTPSSQNNHDNPFIPLLSIITPETSTATFSTDIKKFTTGIISKSKTPASSLTETSPELVSHFIPVTVSLLRTILSFYQSGGVKASGVVVIPAQPESTSSATAAGKLEKKNTKQQDTINPVSVPPKTLRKQHLIMALIGMWIDLKAEVGMKLFTTSIPVMSLLTNLTWFDARFAFTTSRRALFQGQAKDILGFIEEETIKEWWSILHFDLSLSSDADALLDHFHALRRVVALTPLFLSKKTSVKMIDLSAQVIRSISLLWDNSEPMRAAYYAFWDVLSVRANADVFARFTTEVYGDFRVISTNTISKPLLFQPRIMKREMAKWTNRLSELESLRQKCVRHSKFILDNTDGTPTMVDEVDVYGCVVKRDQRQDQAQLDQTLQIEAQPDQEAPKSTEQALPQSSQPHFSFDAASITPLPTDADYPEPFDPKTHAFPPTPIASTPPCPFIASLPDDFSIYKIPATLPLDELYRMFDAVGPASMYEVLFKERQFDLLYQILTSPYRIVHEGIVAYIPQSEPRVMTYNLYEIQGLEKALIIAPTHFDYCQRLAQEFIAIYTWPLLRMERELRQAKMLFEKELTWNPNPNLSTIVLYYNLFFRIINAYPPNKVFRPLIGYLTPSYDPKELRRAEETFLHKNQIYKTIINTVTDQQGLPFRHVNYNNMSPLPIQNALGVAIANCLDMMCNAFFSNSLQCWWLNHLQRAKLFEWYLTYTRNGRLLSIFSNVFAHTQEWGKKAEAGLDYEDFTRFRTQLTDQADEQFKKAQEKRQNDKKDKNPQLIPAPAHAPAPALIRVIVPDHSIPPEPFEVAEEKYLVHPVTDLVEDSAFTSRGYHYLDIDQAHFIETPVTYHPVLEMSYFHGFLQDLDCMTGLVLLMEITDKQFEKVDETIKAGKSSKKFHLFPYEDVLSHRLDAPVCWRDIVYPLRDDECLDILFSILNDSGANEHGAFDLKTKIIDAPLDENGAPLKIKKGTAGNSPSAANANANTNATATTTTIPNATDAIDATEDPPSAPTAKALPNLRPNRFGGESLPDLVVYKYFIKNRKSSAQNAAFLSHLWKTALTKILSRSVWQFPAPKSKSKNNPFNILQQANLGAGAGAGFGAGVGGGELGAGPEDELGGNHPNAAGSPLLLLPKQKLLDLDTPHAFPVPVKPPVYLTLLNIYGTYLGLEGDAKEERDEMFDEPGCGEKGMEDEEEESDGIVKDNLSFWN